MNHHARDMIDKDVWGVDGRTLRVYAAWHFSKTAGKKFCVCNLGTMKPKKACYRSGTAGTKFCVCNSGTKIGAHGGQREVATRHVR